MDFSRDGLDICSCGTLVNICLRANNRFVFWKEGSQTCKCDIVMLEQSVCSEVKAVQCSANE